MSRKSGATRVSVAALALAGWACAAPPIGPQDFPGGDGPQVRPLLVRLPGGGMADGAGLTSSAPPGGYAWSNALTITAFRSPIRAIWLEGDDRYAPVYQCEADTNDGCLVDLAGPALQDLLGAAPVAVQAGVYDAVRIYTCANEGGYQADLTGSVTLDGRTWVTSRDSVLAAAGPAEPVRIDYAGCAREYVLPTPVVMDDSLGGAVALRLYFDIRDLAWASLGGDETAGGWIPGGCAGPRPEAGANRPYLCTGYPDVAGVVDSVAPVIERYRLNGGATLGLIFRASGGFVGGFTRRYFEAGAAANPGFNADTPVEDWIDNGDGTYQLTTFGGTGPDGGPVGHYLSIGAFQRATHSGSATGFQGSVFSYTAVRIE